MTINFLEIAMSIHTGRSHEQRAEVAKGLNHFLANNYLLYLKTQNYHWNVESHHFKALHMMFEEQYQELQEAVDEIAERIRALGHRSPGSFAEFVQLSTLHEAAHNPSADEMVKHLLSDHEAMTVQAHHLLKDAERHNDP